MDLIKQRMNKRRRGSAMVELVFILPIMCMLIFAVAEFGIAFGQWQTINNAAREGARFAIVFRGTCDPGVVGAEVIARVDAYASAMGGIAPGDVNVDPQNVCGAAGTDAQVDVELLYSFAILPGFSSVSPTITLKATSTMRNEG